MSVVMLRRSLDTMRMIILSYAGSIFVYALLIALLFPSVRRSADLINKFIKSFPPAVLKLMGLQNYSTFPHFMGGEFLNLIWPIIAAVFVIMAGSAVVAQEVEQGTVDLWLSVPESRIRLLAGKLAAVALGVCVLAAATDLALIIGARLVGETVLARGILALSVYLILFPLTIGAFAATVSSVSARRGQAAGISAAVLVLSYLLWVVSLTSSRWSWLQHLSVFSIFHPQEALADARLSGGDVLCFVFITAVLAAFSLVAFQRRPTL
jgi:ABC-2 type transport system permease protein